MKRSVAVLFAAALLWGGTGAAQQHINQRKGFNAENTYDFLGLDNVNLFSGNLVLTIPIGQSYEVGPGLSYGLQFVCNGNSWDTETAEGVHRWKPQDPSAIPYKALPNRRSNAGMGCLVSLGRLIPPGTATNRGVWWIYETPDGGEHFFHPTLRAGETDADDFQYTRDSTFLRLRFAGGRAFLDAPDGTVYEFEPDPASPIGAWRLLTIRNQYPDHHVTVAYAPNRWTISDSLGRNHVVHFADLPNDGATVPMVSRIELAAFQERVATYTFTYSAPHETIERPAWDSDDAVTGTPDEPVVPLVETISLPDGTSYQLDYVRNSSDSVDAGVPSLLRLPAQGCVSWAWGVYGKPSETSGLLHLQGSRGVRRRVVSDRRCVQADLHRSLQELKAEAIGVWTYEPRITPAGNATTTPREMTNTVTDPLGNYVVHYFSVLPGSLVDGGFYGVDYGLPFTRNVSSGGHFLSRETFTAGGNRLRREYVRYERDGAHVLLMEDDPSNVRVAATRVTYDDDGGRHVDVTSSDYDGFGHYRQVTTSGGTLSPGLTRTTRTEYASSPPALWLLELRTASETVQGEVRLRTETCFDPQFGFPVRSRRIKSAAGTRGPNDVVGAFTFDPGSGNITSESWYGGDSATVPAGAAWCTDPLAAPAARIRYRINFIDGSVRKSTAEYIDPPSGSSGMGFFIVDLTLDRNTGLVAASRDTSGIETLYDYDTLGRPTHERPAGRAWTVYDYLAAGAGTPARAVARQFENGAVTGDALMHATYEFDDVGRLVLARRDVPGTTDSVQRFTYNALGWKTFVGEPGPPEATAGTTLTHDAFGRVLTSRTADGQTANFAYTGVREKRRRTRVATPLAIDQEVETIERYDAFARLAEVVEKSGPTSAAAPIGADVTTRYTYDAADRLTGVRMAGAEGAVQTRMFDYDGRGFLRWESHPESGLTSYTYDARGRVTSRTQSEARSQYDLLYEYDSAERMTRVRGRDPLSPTEFREMKAFTYAAANAGPTSEDPRWDFRRGKLHTATRYNYPDGSGPIYEVTHTYAYKDAAGRKTDRETVILIPGPVPVTLQTLATGFEYDDLDLPRRIRYPMCLRCGGPSPGPPDRRLEPTYERGRVKSIPGFVTNIGYGPNGMWSEIDHANGIRDVQTADETGMVRPLSITTQYYDTCTPPSLIVQPSGAEVSSSAPSATLSVVAGGTAPFTYQWYVVPNPATPSLFEAIEGATSPSYTVSPTSTRDYFVEVTNVCRTVVSRRATVSVGGCPQPQAAIEAARHSDGTWSLQAKDVKVRGAAAFTWRRLPGGEQVGQGESITLTIAQTATFTLTVQDDCGTVTAIKLVDIPLPVTRSELVATALSPGHVTVTWPATPGASAYRVYRGDALIATTQATEYADVAVEPDRTYVYRVRAVDANGTSVSTFSNSDVASTKFFPTVIPGSGASAAVFDEMLAAVNMVRAAAGWQPVAWRNILALTDPVPQPGAVIKSTHLTALRARMNEALQALGVRTAPYNDSDPLFARILALQANEIFARTR